MSFTLSPLTSLGLVTLIFILALVLALAIDRYLGEPAMLCHPVVWMGHYLGWAGRQLAPLARSDAPDYTSFWLGTLAWFVGAASVAGVAAMIQIALIQLPDMLGPLAGGAFAVLGLGWLLKSMLSWALLRSEALAVEAALAQSLSAGRERLRWLVSRDVTQLTEVQVRESAIETLAENLNDSVVAPIFWFVLLGLPGAALYRFANTADAMWGYRGVYNGQNWEWAGKWAARADDMLSWIPARITAVLLLVVVWIQRLASGRPQLIDTTAEPDAPDHDTLMARLWLESSHTPSPNSGWPMAAMALALDVSLHKPGVYVLNAAGRAPQAPDTERAVVLASSVLSSFVFFAVATLIFVAMGGAP